MGRVDELPNAGALALMIASKLGEPGSVELVRQDRATVLRWTADILGAIEDNAGGNVGYGVATGPDDIRGLADEIARGDHG